MRIQGFNGEEIDSDERARLSTITKRAFQDYTKPSFFAGEKTIAAYSLLYKRHVVILNLSYKADNGSIQDGQVIINRYVNQPDKTFISYHMDGMINNGNLTQIEEDVPFGEDANGRPNYIVIVRHGGHQSHFQPLRRNDNKMMIKLSKDIIDMLNEERNMNKTRFSYEEFFNPKKQNKLAFKKSALSMNPPPIDDSIHIDLLSDDEEDESAPLSVNQQIRVK